MTIQTVSKEVAGRNLTLQTGRLARQADGAVTISYGETVVLCTAMMSEHGDPSADFFRLTMEYQERFYAAGKIKGSRFVKRDGRSSEEGILTARLMDRPIRPLFPKGITNEVQGIATVLSADLQNEPGIISLTGMSAAMMAGGLPFAGPLAGVRIGMKDGKFIVFPTMQEVAEGTLDLIVAGTKDAITMVEAGSNEVTEEQYLEALKLAHEVIRELCALQEELVAKIQPTARTFEVAKPKTEIVEMVAQVITDADLDTFGGVYKKEIKASMHALEAKLLAHFASAIEEGTQSEGALLGALQKLMDEKLRKNILQSGKRIDGRAIDEIRPVSCEVSLLPRTHGSALFQRGETQALTLTTLGGPQDAQIIDQMDQDTHKRYIHYYNFPPCATGEVMMLRGSSRREIGHGALAERALAPMIPDKAIFPYTILLVSEITTCNGSSSMASVCGSTLSLMDAGVPLKKPVAGIAMGLVCSDEFKQTGNGSYVILTDIQGFEDFAGDMDFKVAGTADGITALQMDIKVKGITIEMMGEAMQKAKTARASIMAKMLETLPTHRAQLSKHAPLILTMQIDPDFIRDVIGKGGETIQKITAECGVEMDIEQNGIVTITAPNQENGQKAIDWVNRITYVPKPGDELEGTVVSVVEFGAFVEIAPGRDGLVHISEMRPYRVNSVSEIVKVGDHVKVKVIGMDQKGKISLTMKPYFEGATPTPAANPQSHGNAQENHQF